MKLIMVFSGSENPKLGISALQHMGHKGN